MKKIIIVFAAIVIIACNSSKEKNKLDETASKEIVSEMNSDKINDTVVSGDSVILLGKANRNGLRMDAFQNWFDEGYKSYQLDSETVSHLKSLLKGVEITAFMGTWCSDSQREIPHFYKILDQTGFDESKLTLITVSEEKTTPQGYEDGLNITNVPTLIFSKDGKELGRIVEYPIEGLEKDMLAIVSGKDYKHAYSE
ncbi:thioredoxin family protein [Aequorivita echinoideorum]|nr:thioredoxin family protein [Aequorivita echinoideorum]